MKESANSKTGIRLSDRQRLNWLRLIRTDNIGPVTFRDLILFCGSASSALEMLPDLNIRGGSARPIRVMSMDDAERELETIERSGARLVGMGEPDYPPQLKNCEAPPPLVTIKGNAAVFSKPPVAIVGSRNASVIGARFTERLANDLGEAGFAVISGLARGIDAAAHRASLKTGTVAVLAGGLDRPYPPENLPLYRAIPEEGGVLISEMPMGAEPRSRDFPRRNRIIAGLSLGLIVVEAAERSGSLISARMAGDMGRTVFAVPGSPLDPRARGTNLLLKQGATLSRCSGRWPVQARIKRICRHNRIFCLRPWKNQNLINRLRRRNNGTLLLMHLARCRPISTRWFAIRGWIPVLSSSFFWNWTWPGGCTDMPVIRSPLSL